MLLMMMSPSRLVVLCSLALATGLVWSSNGQELSSPISSSSSFGGEEKENNNIIVQNGPVEEDFDSFEMNGYDPEHQRREMWDVWSLMVMWFQGDCGPASVRLGDHPKCQMCKLGDAYACDELCEMRSHHGKSEYAKFCKGLTLTSDTTSESWAQEENYDGLEGNVGGEGSMSRAFQFWMLATAASVVMAMVAVFMGQRRERREARGIGAGGAVLSGAVGRRHTAVSAFADGVLPSRVAGGVAAGAVGSAAAVEMSSYQLDDGGVNPDYPPEEEGVEQVMV